MKKVIGKIFTDTVRKIKEPREHIKKLIFSNHKEDFVITDQEEKEGGFFGINNLKITSSLK